MNLRLSFAGVVLLSGCFGQSEEPPPRRESQPAQPSPVQLRADRPCAEAPAWTRLSGRCDADGFTYAADSSGAIPNRAMRLHVAGDRARAALAVDPSAPLPQTVVLERSEVVDMVECEGAAWALARRPTLTDHVSLPVCGAEVSERASPIAECPAWSTELATIDGERIRGVGYAIGMKNAAMARSVASNRAVAEQRKSMGLQVTRDVDGSVSTGTSSQTTAVQESSDVQTCGEVTVARVTSRVMKR
ncbi:MAG: hypothetical protein AAFY60_06405 [Myxococcota bacterium]